MPMDPLDPYVQLVMEAPPSPNYIPGPEAPPSPDYIPGPEVPPLPDYIPGSEYPEYLPPADDVLLAKEQPLPVAVSPTAESPGYITDSKPEMEPEDEDGDDEKSEEDSIDYPANKGDDDADDEGDDLSEDDADEEESSDSEEEEDKHLALTVPTPALHSSISGFEDSDETEPFEEGETVATPPPFGYRIATRISVQPHILMPFRSESEVERLLAIPTPSLSPVSPTSYPLPPFLMPLLIFTPLPPPSPIILPRTRTSMVLMRSAAPSTFILAPRSRTPPLLPIPLPTSSFPLPLFLTSTSGGESIPEADIPLRKRDHFTTPTSGYEVGESSVADAARQIRPALTIADSRRAEDRLIDRLRRERRYFRTLSTTYAQETTYLRNEITNFLQKPNKTFNEAWERFKDLLRQCPHHGFSEQHQLDTFYNALNPNDQDALDSAVGGDFLDKIPRECLSIIESKSKVRYSRCKVTDIVASLEDKLDMRMNRFEKSLNDMKNSFITPTAPLKAAEETAAVGEAKAITTRSGMSYKEPPIPPPGVDQQEPTEETTDTELPSPEDIQPPLVQVEVQVYKPAEEPSIVIPKAKAN
nr:reverse transcriptase domain-containing protein [Tanacetum cinerariifolium]